MGPDWAVSAVFGWAMVLAGGALALRHMLLNPAVESWPDAPGWLRELMFALMVVSIFWGLDTLLGLDRVPTRIPIWGAVFGLFFAIYQGGMAWNVLRQHYRKEVWRRLKRINYVASCGQGGALAFLMSFGWTVVPKNGGRSGLVERD